MDNGLSSLSMEIYKHGFKSRRIYKYIYGCSRRVTISFPAAISTGVKDSIKIYEIEGTLVTVRIPIT
jgi:hypothetical protein